MLRQHAPVGDGFLVVHRALGDRFFVRGRNIDSPVKSPFCAKIVLVAAGFSLRSRREMVSRLSQAKACDYHLGTFYG